MTRLRGQPLEEAAARGEPAAFYLQAVQADQADPEWSLLLIEFRVHAAPDPALNRRYAEAHRRTIAGVGRVLAKLHDSAGLDLPMPAAAMAEAVFALSWGAQLERAANPDALPASLVAGLVGRLLAVPVAVARDDPI